MLLTSAGKIAVSFDEQLVNNARLKGFLAERYHDDFKERYLRAEKAALDSMEAAGTLPADPENTSKDPDQFLVMQTETLFHFLKQIPESDDTPPQEMFDLNMIDILPENPTEHSSCPSFNEKACRIATFNMEWEMEEPNNRYSKYRAAVIAGF